MSILDKIENIVVLGGIGVASYYIYQWIKGGGGGGGNNKPPELKTDTRTAPSDLQIANIANEQILVVNGIAYTKAQIEAEYNKFDEDIKKLQAEIAEYQTQIETKTKEINDYYDPLIAKLTSTVEFRYERYNYYVQELAKKQNNLAILNTQDIINLQAAVRNARIALENSKVDLANMKDEKAAKVNEEIVPIQQNMAAAEQILTIRIIAQDEFKKLVAAAGG